MLQVVQCIKYFHTCAELLVVFTRDVTNRIQLVSVYIYVNRVRDKVLLDILNFNFPK